MPQVSKTIFENIETIFGTSLHSNAEDGTLDETETNFNEMKKFLKTSLYSGEIHCCVKNFWK